MQQILFQTEYFTISTFWLFFIAAFISSTIILVKLADEKGLKIQFLSENSFKLIITSIIVSRIFGILFNFQTYFYEFSKETFLSIFYIWDKGFSFWALVFTFLIYFYKLCKKNEQEFFKWLDVFAPAIIFGIAIGNIGAFFEGINYGNETSLPWGVNFESPAIKYTVPIHPTQIYAFIYAITLFAGAMMLSNYKRFKEKEFTGLLGLILCIAFFFLKFLEEFLRGDDMILLFDKIRLSQVLTLLATILFCIILYIRYNKRAKDKEINK
ncbi:MAG: prolipoprotein diacylglyceryl transferase family protein [Candidatus Gracilibacteria bacterium]|jgi:phosphatidylglycerol:prolipoprotein diacylglycerol transferase